MSSYSNIVPLKPFLPYCIPFVTGWGVPEDVNTGKLHLDGGFSRVLHPPCQHHVGVHSLGTWHC